MRKAKKEYFDNLDLEKITDNKTFWKTITPFFTNKGINKVGFTLHIVN